MKTVNTVIAGVFLLCLATCSVQAGDIKKQVAGKWEITIPDAPENYQKYTLDVRVENGKVLFNSNGGDVDVKNREMIEKDNRLETTMYVGESVFKILIWEENRVVKGSVDTSMGVMPVLFKKLDGKKR